MVRRMRSSSLWIGFLIGNAFMLSLQLTLLQQIPPAIPSVLTLEQATTTLDCDGLEGTRVLLLDVHLEGNLGDEMETTPLLQELRRCGVHITALLSGWLDGPEQQLSVGAVRQHGFIDSFESPGNYYRFIPSDYDAIIQAPGPWRLCEMTHWPFRIDIFMGGSLLQEELPCDLSLQFEEWEPSLVTVREPRSFRRLQNTSRWNQISYMSGDLTHSFDPVPSSVEYWKRIYAGHSKRSLVFVRASNANATVSVKPSGVELTTFYSTSVSIPRERVVFATSSAVEDQSSMEAWKQENRGIFQDHQFVVCRTVEQLFGLISQAANVYTDRYHPGVVAHLLNKSITFLRYDEEQSKLSGLYELVSSNIAASSIRTKYNKPAFARLRDTLRKLRSDHVTTYGQSPSASQGRKLSSVPSGSKLTFPTQGTTPTAIVVGLPKSGTTSLYHFFSCSGYSVSHYCCCGSDATQYPCTGGQQLSQRLHENLVKGRNLWEGIDHQIHTQLDGESQEDTYFLPQHDNLKELEESAPNAIWILPIRPAQKWKLSVQNWLDLANRLQHIHQVHHPSVDFELESFYLQHNQAIRDYCRNFRQPHLCIEVEIDQPDAAKKLMNSFPETKASCWGQHNMGPFFQAVTAT